MKYLMILAIFGLNFSAQASVQSCQKLAEKAAVKVAVPSGQRSNSSLIITVGSTGVAKQGNDITFKVQVDFDINDGGSSDGFPSEYYLVAVTDSGSVCQVREVKSVNK